MNEEEEQKQYDEAMQGLREFIEKLDEGYWSKRHAKSVDDTEQADHNKNVEV